MLTTLKRIRVLGIVLAVAGATLAGVGFFYGVPTANDGLDSAQAMYAAQGVELNYNEDGELVDRGTTEGADRIMALLVDEWRYPLNEKNLDPDDPLVNTRDELMFQYATITYHVYHGERTVVLAEEDVPLTYRGVEYTEAGEYEIAPLAYYAELDRSHPIERQLREAWSPLALSLTGYLSSGHANQAAGELARMTSFGMGGIGLLFVLAGSGLIWVSFARPEANAVQRIPAAVARTGAPASSAAPRAPAGAPARARHARTDAMPRGIPKTHPRQP